jgi:hypothetical protein
MRKIKAILSALAGFWRRSRISLIIAAVLVIGVIFIGLRDVGIILGYLATTIVMVELTRRWRRIRNFTILLFASFFGIIFLAFLHEVVVLPLISLLLGAGALDSLGFYIFSDAVSLIILFIGPVGMFIGFLGAIVLGVFRLVSLGKKRKTEAKI